MSLSSHSRNTLRPKERAAVLLEVILALVLFVAAATMLSTALHSSMEGVARRRLLLHAADLAVSVMSEIQMGIRPVASSGPDVFKPPFELWSSQVAVAVSQDDPAGGSGLAQVEVVIRHKEMPVVHRLSELLPATSDPSTNVNSTLGAEGGTR